MMVWLMSALLACDEAPAEPPASPAPAPATDLAPPPVAEPALTDSTGGAAGLPDVSASLPKGQCSSGPGNEGADSYFVGDIKINGSQITGTETWVLYANPKWKAKGGRDCTLTWNITGSMASGGGSCGACDSTLTLSAVAQKDSSNCPEELIFGRLLPNGQRAGGEGTDWSNRYAIQRRPDGTVKVHFAGSGKLLGEGYHNAGGLNYVSAHQCKWF